MVSGALISLVVAVSAAGSPPPAEESGSADQPLITYSDRAARADAAVAALAEDAETCPNDATSAVLVIPITDRGRLFGYAFVTPRLCLARGVNAFSVTNEMHFIVDEMVRAAHRTPITLGADQALNRDATLAAMLEAARGVVGESRIERLVLLGEDFTAVR